MAVSIGATGRAWPCIDRYCSEIERGPLAGLGRPYSFLERPCWREAVIRVVDDTECRLRPTKDLAVAV